MSNPKQMSYLIRILLTGILWPGLIGSLISVTAIFSAYHIVFDLLANFRIQYIVLIFGLLCLAFVLRRYWIALALACCLAVHIFDVARSQLPISYEATVDGPTLRVMGSNLLVSNTQHEQHIEYIKEIEPDVIIFVEYTNAWENALLSSLTEYPYKISIPRERSFGIAVFSKLPFNSENSMVLANADRPTVEVVVPFADSNLTIMGIHPPPPISQHLYRQRNSQLEALADVTKEKLTPLVVLGDFNITPWSHHFREFIETGKLQDGRRGFGILPTWPSGFFPLQIPIDHVIVNDRVRIVSMGTSSGLSSDHRSVWADLRLR